MKTININGTPTIVIEEISERLCKVFLGGSVGWVFDNCYVLAFSTPQHLSDGRFFLRQIGKIMPLAYHDHLTPVECRAILNGDIYSLI